jgi:hypothetical protein
MAIFGLRSFSAMPTPARVPPVPTAQMKAVQLAVCLLPDLRARGADVPVPVGDVVELVRPDGTVRVLLGEALGEPA